MKFNYEDFFRNYHAVVMFPQHVFPQHEDKILVVYCLFDTRILAKVYAEEISTDHVQFEVIPFFELQNYVFSGWKVK